MSTHPTRRVVLFAAAVTTLGHRAGWAQESNRTYRLGILAALPRGTLQSGGVIDELGKAGFVEGKNLIVDWRLQGSPEQTAASVKELVRLAPDVLSAAGTQGMVAAQAETRTIPILGVADDLVASGLVPSLARPGGNVTGISILASELDSKRQEILMELVPTSRHMAALVDPGAKGPEEIQTLWSALQRAGSNCRSFRCAPQRKSRRPSMAPELPAPRPLMCWPPAYSTPIARSYWTSARCYACPRSTNGPRRRRKAASPPTVVCRACSIARR